MILILDTNIILRYPKLLGLNIPKTKLVITSEVLEELNENSQIAKIEDSFFELLNTAIKSGNISIFDSESETIIHDPNFSSTYGKVDNSLFIAAFFYKHTSKDKVKIASLDREVQKIAKDNSFEIYNIHEIRDLISQNSKNQPLLQKIIKFEKNQTLQIWLSIISSSVATLIATKSYENISSIIATINVWGTIILILFFGILLFVLREKQRLGYGLFEFLIGAVGIILLFEPTKFNYDNMVFDMDFGIKLLGGLYIMVRGQDNIVKSLKNKKLGIMLKEKYGIGE